MSNEIINIKGTRNGLVIFLDTNRDFDEIKTTLLSKIEASKGFFRGAKFTLNLDGLGKLTSDRTRELEDICVTNGLVLDNSIPWPTGNFDIPEKDPVKHQVAEMKTLPESKPAFSTVGVNAGENKACLLVEKSLRSGQKMSYNGNVVILGDVNAGSEVTATGDVIVYGSLRGVVHAGANSSEDSSIIMAYRLNPIQLRIGSIISRPPENAIPSSLPEIARIRDGQMVIEPYQTSGTKM